MGASNYVKHFLMDGWNNLVTGLGSSADKKKYTKHRLGTLINDLELESIFIEDGLGARIVTELPNDMFREGWEYAFPNLEEKSAKETVDVYKDIMEQIGAIEKIKAAFYWARLYGGAIIFIGALDGQSLDKPLNPNRIRYFDNLRVIDRSNIKYEDIQFQLDPTKPRYGLPEQYPIKYELEHGVSQIQYVHYSRIIEIHGVQVPSGATERLTKEQRYWGISVIQNVNDHLTSTGSSLGAVASLLNEFSVGKFKLSNFVDILSQPDGQELMKKRIEINDLSRSVFHSMYMDKEDEFVRENITFSGIPEVLYIFMMMVSSCSGYPITRLFGVSPGGLNSTGESDMRNYYDRVKAEQVSMLGPILLRIVKIIAVWQKKEEPYIEFRPLQQLTDKEKSELEKLDAEKEQVKANTWKTYIDAGIIEPYQAAFLQFGDDLDKIPAPDGYELPPVEPVPEPGTENEKPEGTDTEEGGDANDEEEPASKESEENNEPPPDETKEGENGEEPDQSTEDRIAELEAKKELTEEEQNELDELKKQIEEDNKAKQGSQGKK